MKNYYYRYNKETGYYDVFSGNGSHIATVLNETLARVELAILYSINYIG